MYTTKRLRTITISPPCSSSLSGSSGLSNRTVLMSNARFLSADQPINPYYFDPHVDIHLAQAEHDTIAQAFSAAGINVVKVASPSDSPDGVYTANWALVRGDKAVLARLPDTRKAEEAYAQAMLEQLGKTVLTVPDGLHFSGQGDALACGNYLLCGQGYRSDEAAQAYAAEALGYERIQLQTIPQLDVAGHPVINPVSGWHDSFFYDIDLALAILRHPSQERRGLIAYCPDAFTPESHQMLNNLPQIDILEVSLEEATKSFALSLVSTGESVIMSATAPHFQARLETLGFSIYTPLIHELSKGGGYIRCTSLTLD